MIPNKCSNCKENNPFVRLPGTQEWWCAKCMTELQTNEELQIKVGANKELVE